MAVGAAVKAETAVARTGPAMLAEAVAGGRRTLCSEISGFFKLAVVFFVLSLH